MAHRIIALKGPSQSGKTTLANLLKAEYARTSTLPDRYTHITSFSDYVRGEIVDSICGEVEFEDQQIPSKLRSDLMNLERQLGAYEDDIRAYLEERPASELSRRVQQRWGQDFRRAQDPLYWIKKSFNANIEHILNPNCTLIEGSCRQPNEGAYIHALGGIVIDLAPLAPPTSDEAAGRSHAVETIAGTWQGDLQVNMADYFALENLPNAKDEQAQWIQALIDYLPW